MSSYYAYQGGGAHAMTPLVFHPRGNPDAGRVWHGVIHVFSNEGHKVTDDIGSSFAHVPVNYQAAWQTYADCPRGTNLYTTTDEVEPQDINSFLTNARNHRAALARAAGTMPPDPEPPLFGAPPRYLQDPPLNEVSDQAPGYGATRPEEQAVASSGDNPPVQGFDPADADRDGTVSAKERRRHQRSRDKT